MSARKTGGSNGKVRPELVNVTMPVTMPRPSLSVPLKALMSGGGISESTPTDERILDATRDLVAIYGTRFSINDVAERSGVARATLFRRYGNKDTMLSSMFTREVQRVIAELGGAVADASDAESAVVDLFTRALELSQTNPIARRFLAADPARVLDMLTRGDPSPLDLGRAIFAERIRAAQADGRARAVRAEEVSDVLIHLILAYGLMPDAPVDLLDKRQVRAFAKRVLAPFLLGKPAPRSRASSR